MAQRYFAVAFSAVKLAEKGAHLSTDIATGKSSVDVIRRGMAGFKLALPAEDGWSDWIVVARRIPARRIARVIEEAQWFDQTGAHRLFAMAMYAGDPARGRSVLMVGHVLSFNRDCAEQEVRTLVRKDHPEANGWTIVGFDLEELNVRRRRPLYPPRWVPENVTIH
jgi:hypothetical protein